MARSAIRFRPPEVVVSPEIRWMLLRAFGPARSPFEESFVPEQAVAHARLFEIAARISSRHSRGLLRDELGAEWERELFADRRQAVFVSLQRIAAARDVARIAARRGIPLALLKFLALHFSGVLEIGSRAASDIDLLVPEARVAELHQALRESGYVERDQASEEHHLPPLDHPKHGLVESHVFLPGVSVDGGLRPSTYEALEASRMLSPAKGLPGECHVPRAEIQIAHLVAHGIAQHGAHPDAYSPVRMLADLIDLGVASGERDEEFRRAETRTAQVVSATENLAVRELCQALGRGRIPLSTVLGSAEPAGVLLRHLLAGLLDQDYQNALNLQFFPRAGLTGRTRPVVAIALIKRALFPTRGELDKIHGRRHSSVGYLARWAARPFYLLGRLVRYGASAVRLRLKRL